MLNTRKIETIMSVILSIGLMISVGFVILGGAIYLFKHAHENIHFDAVNPVYSTNPQLILENALYFSPFGIIQLGLLILVLTQIARVGLLVWFYGVIRDYWFFFISLFVLIVLIGSIIIQS